MADRLKVLIYARCSTTDLRQDVGSQIDACKKYCDAQNWQYEILQEYESAYTDKPRKIFNQALERIRLKEFSILMVFMLDRFSRQTPTKIVSDLHIVVEQYHCRFISIKENIDSATPMWELVMMLFGFMAHNFSRMLGIRVKAGIANKKSQGKYFGGRPRKKINLQKIKALRKQGFGLRSIAREYNKDLPKKQQVSYVSISKLLK